jgi:hypothetical protein
MQDSCPSCGNTETLEGIKDEIEAMREEGRRRARRIAQEQLAASFRKGKTIKGGSSGGQGGAITINGGSGGLAVASGDVASHAYMDHQGVTAAMLEITDRKTCSKCGTWWMPNAAETAEQLRDELLKVTNEVRTPIERLAKLAPPDEV